MSIIMNNRVEIKKLIIINRFTNIIVGYLIKFDKYLLNHMLHILVMNVSFKVDRNGFNFVHSRA